MIFFRSKKCTLILLIIAVLTMSALHTPRVQAAFGPPIPVPEPTAVPTGDKASIMNTFINSFKEISLDGLITSATKVVTANITQSIVNWINSGFRGSPAFVSDPQGFLIKVADQTAGDFIQNETQWGFVCDPFKLDIRIALNLGYSSNFQQQNFCRLSGILNNAENFAEYTAGNFSQGSWGSWFEISQNPSSNPHGALIASKGELRLRTSQATLDAKEQLNWGEGFLSWRDCLHEDENKECTEFSEIKTPGSVINEQLNFTLGTGQRQLELADEYNEIIGALIGQLAKTVLTQGLSSFGVSGSNYGSLSGEADDSLVVSCAPNRVDTTIGQTVTWRARVVGENLYEPMYVWHGHPEIEGKMLDEIEVEYDTTGEKRASIDVSFLDETGTERIYKEDCVTGVNIRQTSIFDEL